MQKKSDSKRKLPSVEIVVLPEGAGRAELNAALNASLADVVVLTGPRGGVNGRALPLLAEIFLDPSVIVAYSDEERVDKRGRHLRPIYKPDWSPERFRSHFYIGGLLAVRRSDALRSVLDSAIDDSIPTVRGPSLLWDLVLRLTEQGGNVESNIGGNANWDTSVAAGAGAGLCSARGNPLYGSRSFGGGRPWIRQDARLVSPPRLSFTKWLLQPKGNSRPFIHQQCSR
jgi:hypothetical protein